MKLNLVSAIFVLLPIMSSYALDNLGSHNNQLKIAIVPSSQAIQALDSAKPVAKCIEQKSKIFITLQIPNSYIAVVEAMGAQKVDLAFGDIVSFIIARNKFGAEPLLQTVRYGMHSYQSAIFVKSNSAIKTVKDLNGKKFAYSDASSASSYIYPSILMKNNNAKFAQEVATGSMDASIIALMQGQVDAAAAYYNAPDKDSGKMLDARARVAKIYPNIYKETKILWLSKPIPNEPVYVRKGLSKEIKTKLASAISQCVKDFPNAINNIQGLLPVNEKNNEYDDFIKEIEKSGLNISSIFNKN